MRRVKLHQERWAMPVNMAIVPSRYGVRASILTGFNLFR
jgi:hypothetical protein